MPDTIDQHEQQAPPSEFERAQFAVELAAETIVRLRTVEAMNPGDEEAVCMLPLWYESLRDAVRERARLTGRAQG